VELNKEEKERVDKVREIIISISSKDILDKIRCRKCKTTGLGNVYWGKDGLISWDGISYCDYCKGVGYHNPAEFDKNFYICNRCKGEGMITTTN